VGECSGFDALAQRAEIRGFFQGRSDDEFRVGVVAEETRAELIPVTFDVSPISASGPARGAPGHRGHCRVGLSEQFRLTGGWVMAFSGDSEAMDKQAGQRQCDGQQQPGPQPGR
jgi:hypothetical protein